MEEEIVELIVKWTGYEKLRENKDVDLLEEDILDSLAFIEIITELEEEFDIEIQPTQVPQDTWRSVDNIVKMVKEKIKERD